jgi:hypothetical protein
MLSFCTFAEVYTICGIDSGDVQFKDEIGG